MVTQNIDWAAGFTGRLCGAKVLTAGGNDDTAIVGLVEQLLGGAILYP